MRVPGPGAVSSTHAQAAQLSSVKLAFAAQQAREQLELAGAEPIAVLGMGCRFPGGCDTPARLWQALWRGDDALRPIPPERWDVERYFDPEPAVPGHMYVREGGFLDDVTGFDAAFFGIAPREADCMDPQQRVLLEVCWEALEHAGLRPSRLRGSETGVWIGAMHYDYAELLAQSGSFDAHAGSGARASVLAGRVAHVFGLRGPAMTVDTACSSSLVAAHLAVQALRARSCELALVGGVNLMLAPEITIVECQMRMLSPRARCRAFDAGADGFVRGEGCGVLVLKRLCDALADDDRVLAVIRGSAVNHDGASGGLTVPNAEAQRAVIEQALRDGCVLPSQVGYVEAHGTGTALGDPIELRALAAALCAQRSAEQPLWVGSLKTNFGHTEGAAGVGGLLKTVLALAHGRLPPSLHFETPNPHVDWSNSALRVVAQARDFDALQGRRIAGVSSFGFSGTNAHVVCEAMPELGATDQGKAAPRPLPVCLSASSPKGLAQAAALLLSALQADPALTLEDVAHTSCVRRDAAPERLVVLAESRAELMAALAAAAQQRWAACAARGRSGRRAPKLVWWCGRWDARELAAHLEHALAPRDPDSPADARALLARLSELGFAPAAVLGAAAAELRTELAGGAPGSAGAALAGADYVLVFGEAHEAAGAASTAALQLCVSDWRSLLQAAAQLHCAGAAIDWGGLLGACGRLCDLPGQLFERRRHWFPPAPRRGRAAHTEQAALLGAPLALPGLDEQRFEAELCAEPAAWWSDQCVAGDVRLPKLALLAGIWELALLFERPGSVRAFECSALPALPLGAAFTLHTVVRAEQLEILMQRDADGEFAPLARAQFAPESGPLSAPDALAQLRAQLGAALPELTLASAAQVGPRLRSVREVFPVRGPVAGPSAWLAKLQLPARVRAQREGVHPVLLEAAVQLANALQPAAAPCELVRVAAARLYAAAGSEPWLYLRAGEGGFDVRVFSAAGELAAELEGLELAPTPALAPDPGLVELTWQPRRLALAARPGRLPTPVGLQTELRAADMREQSTGSSASHARAAAAAELLEQAAAGFVARGLLELGVRFTPGEQFENDALAAALGVVPALRPLFARLCEVLAEVGALRAFGRGRWVTQALPLLPDPRALLQQLREQYPECAIEQALLGRCAARLPDVLRGRCNALELLFGEQGGQAAEGVYTASIGMQQLNRRLTEAFARCLAASGEGSCPRVLEVGAGTGASTRALLELLPQRGEYLFSDISPHFLARAERELAPLHPGLRSARFDLEQGFARQGLAAASFDVIVAVNVLHATRDLRQTLAGLRELLLPGGLLLVGELTSKRRWLDLTFGLTEGWWRFVDHDLRPDHPLLSRAAWLTLLTEAGFHDPRALDDSAAAEAPGTLLVCARPLATRQLHTLLVAPAVGASAQLREQLAQRLGAAGQRVSQLDQPAQLEAQLQQAAGDAPVDQLVLLAPLELAPLELAPPEPERFDAAEQLLLEVAASLNSAARAAHPPRLRVIAQGALPVPGSALTGLGAAPLRGLVDVAAVELPVLAPLLIDLDPALPASEQLAQLAQELVATEHAGETALALRAGGVRVPRLAARAELASERVWQPDAERWIVITGGLGGLGWALAQWLLARGAGRIALLARRPCDAARAAVLRRWRARGRQVESFVCDVADAARLEAVLGELRTRAPLGGVIHCAGALADGSLLQQTRERFSVPLAAKLHGSWALHRATQADRLELFVLFGSSASLLPNPGQANHAAANCFEDALAAWRRAQGLPALTIAWGPWAEVGAAALLAESLSQRGLRPIARDEGLALCARLFGSDCTHVGVIPRDAQRLRELAAERGVPALLRELLAAAPAQDAAAQERAAQLRSQLLQLPAPRARERLCEALRGWLAETLRSARPESLDPDASLTELGLDSLMAIDLRNRLTRELGLDVAVESLVARTSLRALAIELHEQLAVELLRAPESAAEIAAEELVL